MNHGQSPCLKIGIIGIITVIAIIKMIIILFVIIIMIMIMKIIIFRAWRESESQLLSKWSE